MKNVFLFLSIMLLTPLFWASGLKSAPMSGTYIVGNAGNYTTLTAAMAALSTNGVSGAVTLYLDSDYNQLGDTYPISFGSISGASATNTITIWDLDPGANDLYTTGIATTLINGGKYYIFKNVTITNGNNSGVALDIYNDASYNQFLNCTFEGQNTSLSSGVVRIYYAASGGSGNDNNLFDGCYFGPNGTNKPATAIFCYGTSARENNNNTIRNSYIYNFFNAGLGCRGIYISSYNTGFTIEGNHFYQTDNLTFTSGSYIDVHPIVIENTSGNGFIIKNNYIGGKSINCGGAAWTESGMDNTFKAIVLSVGTTTASVVEGNTIKNLNVTTTATTSLGLIHVTNGSVTVKNNTIGSSATTGSIVYSSSTAFTLCGVFGNPTSGELLVRNNTIGGISTSGAGSLSLYGVYLNGSSTVKFAVTGNTIGSTTISDNMLNSANYHLQGIRIMNSSSVADSISNNTIANLTSTANHTSPVIAGIYAGTGIHKIINNQVYNLKAATKNTTDYSLCGINHYNSGTVPAGQSIKGNTIYNLSNTNASPFAVVIAGIAGYGSSTSGADKIENNLIYNLSYDAGTTFYARGIRIDGGTGVLVSNNMVRLGFKSNGAAVTAGNIMGISRGGLSSNLNIYHNSIYIGGSSVTTGNSYGLYYFNSGCNLYSNIIYNSRSNSTGTGFHYGNYLYNAATIDYNLMYITGTGGKVGYSGAVAVADWATWQGQSKDLHGVFADPLFNDATGITPNLHLLANSPADLTGAVLADVTTDFDNQTRSSLTPSDIGADAGIFDTQAPSVSSANPVNGSTGAAVSTTISLVFSETVRRASDNASLSTSNIASVITFKKVVGNINVIFNATYDEVTRTITVTPIANLEMSTQYSVNVTNVEDLTGNAITGTLGTTFTTYVPSSEKDILSFGFLMANNPGLTQDYTAVIGTNRIATIVPAGTDLSALVATFTTSAFVQHVRVGGITQVSGSTSISFNYTASYTVTAEDGSVKYYAVSVDKIMSLPLSEAAWTVVPVAGWASIGSWSKSSTNYAGGTSPELKYSDVGSNIGDKYITPIYNTQGVSAINIQFKSFVYSSTAGCVLKVQMSSDKINWTDAGWSFTTTGINNMQTVNFDISSGLGTQQFFALTIAGPVSGIDQWYIDNLSITAYSAPTVSTSSISSITAISATGGGNVTATGGVSVTARGICWSTDSNPDLSDNITTDGTGAGSYTSSLTGLTANTTYYVKAYATNSYGTSYGDEVSFATSSTPILTTAAISNIAVETATSGGEITNDGGMSATARGVCWATTADPTLANSFSTDGSGIGTFTSSLTGLLANTTYYVRAYATNGAGTAYGNQQSLTTKNIPAFETADISSIGLYTATGGGNITSDGGVTITARGICWATSENPTTANNFTTDGSGTGAFTSSITGLSHGTSYYVRAYVTTANGTYYATQKSFTTEAIVSLPFSESEWTTIPPAGWVKTGTRWEQHASAYAGGTSPELLLGSGALLNDNMVTPALNTSGLSSITLEFKSLLYGYNSGAYVGVKTSTDRVNWTTENWVKVTNGSYQTHAAKVQITNNLGGITYIAFTIYGTVANFNYWYIDDVLVYETQKPTVSLGSITGKSISWIKCTSTVDDDGDGTISAKGVCWNTTGMPTLSDNFTNEGTGTDAFSSKITGLNPGTTYYVRSYATNGAGTDYSDEVSVTTDNYQALPISESDWASIPPSNWSLIGTSWMQSATSNAGGTSPELKMNSTGAVAYDKMILPPVNTAGMSAITICFKSHFNAGLSGASIQVQTSSDKENWTSTSWYRSSSGGNITDDVRLTITSGLGGTMYLAFNTFGTPANMNYWNIDDVQVYEPTLASVSEATITSLNGEYITAQATVLSDGGTDATHRGFCWNTTGNPTTSNNVFYTITTASTYSLNISGLTPGTTYYIRPYVNNALGTSYGDQISFTTIDYAEVSTTAITNIGLTSAQSGGTILSDGNGSILYRGVCWNTTGNPTAYDYSTDNGSGDGSFTSNLTSLIAGQTYYLRAWVYNQAGYAYGDELSFTTLTMPVVTTSAITGLTNNSAISGGNVTSDGGSPVTARGVCWSTSENPTISNSFTSNGTGMGEFSSSLTGLVASTAYYVRAYVTTAAGTSYGNQLSFTTIDLPTIETEEVSQITTSSAMSGGNILSDGGSSVLARGVCWNTSGDPVISDFKTTDGTGIGTFSSLLTSLEPNTTYYVKAYATSALGTSYGEELSFTTLENLVPVVSGSWADPLVWGGTIPGPGDNVVIGAGLTITIPASKETVECADLTIAPLANLSVEGTLNVNGNLLIESDATGTGSLIDKGTVNVTGTKNMELYLAQNDRYYYVSTPVAGATAAVFGNVAGADKLYWRNTAASAWEQITSPDEVLIVGQGYTTKQENAAQTIAFQGNLNTGAKTINLEHSGDRWNLVGNPYASPMDWGTENSAVAGWSNANIRNTIYVKAGGNFAIWNAALDGEAINGGSRYIPAMQAFWVKSMAPGSKVEMNNNVRVHNGNHLMKQGETLCQKIRVKVSRENYTDEAVLRFHNEALTDMDKLDAEKMFASDAQYPQVFMSCENEKLAIQSLPQFAGVHVQALGFKTAVAGTFTFGFSQLESFGAASTVYLEDKLANKMVNLGQNPVYSFESGICDTENRFSIHIADGTTHYNPFDEPGTTGIDHANNKIQVYSHGSTIYVKAEKAVCAAVMVYNLTGAEIASLKMNGDFVKMDIPAQGQYVVKVAGSKILKIEKVKIE